MEPHQQTKWVGNGDRSNVRFGVRWTRESLDYAQGVLSNRNYNLRGVSGTKSRVLESSGLVLSSGEIAEFIPPCISGVATPGPIPGPVPG